MGLRSELFVCPGAVDLGAWRLHDELVWACVLKAGHCPDVMGQVVGESHGCSFEHDHMVSRCLGIAPEPTVIYKAKRYMSHPVRREVQFLPRGTVPFLKRWGLGAHDQLGNGTTFGPSHISPRSSISMPESVSNRRTFCRSDKTLVCGFSL